MRRPSEGLLGGLWALPSGRRDPKETLEDAMRRSLREKLPVRAVIQREVEPFDTPIPTTGSLFTAFFASRRGVRCRLERERGGSPWTGKGRSPFHGPTGNCSKSSIGRKKDEDRGHSEAGGRGVIGTASKAGVVNMAVYAVPHIVDAGTVAWG